MYLKLNEKEVDIIKQLEYLGDTNFELEDNMLPVEDIIVNLEDLLDEIQALKRKIEDMTNGGTY